MDLRTYLMIKTAEEVGHRVAIPDTASYRIIPAGELGNELNKANEDRIFRLISDYEETPVAGENKQDNEKFLRYLNKLRRYNY